MTKTNAIIVALLNGRTIDQWNHGREFKTTRLGGLVFSIRNMGLEVESRDIKTEGSGKPPVEYFCTKESIKNFLSIEKNRKFITDKYFKKLSETKYEMR